MSLAIKQKFQGVITGALFGDSFGSPFEGATLILPYKECSALIQGQINKGVTLNYTDDTTMTYSICKSLLKMKGFDSKHMAQVYTDDYFAEPTRGFGANIGDVFKKLRATNYEDPFGPAKEQFNGSGSCGNGGAMRISPIALFCFNKREDERQNLVSEVTRLTHTHWQAIVGAQLQCSAIHHLLCQTPPQELLQKLIDEASGLEREFEKLIQSEDTLYTTQLRLIESLLKEKFDPAKVVQQLGNEVLAIRSVPTAIYVFLRSHKDIPEIKEKDVMMRCLYLCIHLGGDTDTIGSMACALAGAFEGHSTIPTVMKERCESFDKAIYYADQLFTLAPTK